ncbi:sporulation integral membrane protein YlbJ [Clostridium algidicarnis]|uniref:sporulation integral membrane protein YlbJ n=1 Tax=Clostridium algidicarnis TaxID=37659 RepID=UPI0027E15087|nr:sporulation integral membrane protein YlbJ [Clostridium algidicarnis]
MKFLLFITIVLIIILLFYLLKYNKVNILMTIILTYFIINFILNPTLCIDASINGAKLFFTSLFPSLFPFIIITNILIAYDGVNIYSRFLGPLVSRPLGLPKEASFALIISMLCGYPLGAKYSCELYDLGDINSSEFSKLISIASNSSPLFLIGSVGTSMLGNTRAGYLLLFSNYLSCVFMAIILKHKYKEPVSKLKVKTIKSSKNNNLGMVLKSSIENAIATTLNIGSYVVIFSVILDIIKNNVVFNIVLNKIYIESSLQKNALSGIILGLIEVTNGCYLLSKGNINYVLSLCLISFLCAFSGLAIIAQIHSFTHKYKEISIIKYVIRKVIQGIISFIITLISLLFLNDRTLFTFSNKTPLTISFKSYIPILLLLFIYFAHYFSKKLFDIS